MKSRITIEVDFDQNSPYIKIVEQESDDVRDGLVKAFRQKFGYESNWARIEFNEKNELGKVLKIYPIGSSEDLILEGERMQKMGHWQTSDVEVNIDDIPLESIKK